MINKKDTLSIIKQIAKDIARENGGVDDTTYAIKIVYDSVKEMEDIDTVEVVLCKNCAYRGLSIQCPMCHEEYYDDDGYMESYTVDHSTDEGFCHCGVSMDELYKEEYREELNEGGLD